MQRWARPAACFLLLAAGCSRREPALEHRAPPPLDAAAHAAQLDKWRQSRLSLLRDPSESALAYVGLWPLREGRTRFGSGDGMDVRLPPPVPAFAGTVIRAGNAVSIEPEQGSVLELEGRMLVKGPIQAVSDRARGTTTLVFGSLRVIIHEENGPSFWIRAYDRDARLSGAAFEIYEPSLAWRVAAKLDPFPEPKIIDVADVTGGTLPATSPGLLRFRVGDADYSLMVMTTGRRESWSAPFKDLTNRSETYAGGRYLRVPAAGPDGWTVIDFNQAYNPPCAYSAFTVCMLPPPSNRLQVAVTAGEKRPR